MSPYRRRRPPLMTKICGITNPDDAVAAAQAGAQWLGLIFVPTSPRSVTVEQARSIIKAAGDIPARWVGVFQNQDAAFIAEAVATCGLHLVQCHGQESADFCSDLPRPTLKVFPHAPEPSEEILQEFKTLHRQRAGQLPALLLDKPKVSEDSKDSGASDSNLNVSLSPDSPWKSSPIPLILAGKLTPDTVFGTLVATEDWPWMGVDVASGVEASPGKKDHQAIETFCQAVRQFNDEYRSQPVP